MGHKSTYILNYELSEEVSGVFLTDLKLIWQMLIQNDLLYLSIIKKTYFENEVTKGLKAWRSYSSGNGKTSQFSKTDSSKIDANL